MPPLATARQLLFLLRDRLSQAQLYRHGIGSIKRNAKQMPRALAVYNVIKEWSRCTKQSTSCLAAPIVTAEIPRAA